MDKHVTKMTSSEVKELFESYLIKQVSEKSASRYIKDLERGFLEAPIDKHECIYEITNPDILENLAKTKKLRESTVFTRKTSGGTAGLAGLNAYIRFLKESRDSYYDFMNHFKIKKTELFDWGMDAIIFPPEELVEEEWESLKKRIENNNVVYIRGYARDGNKTQLFIDFYKKVFGNEHVTRDTSNNSVPKQKLERMTGLKDIYNYQVSHIWGQTKNIYLFESPWNICYTPKIIDPFTGHEAKGDLPREFKELFLKYIEKKYKKYIAEYNEIMAKYDFNALLEEFCKGNNIDDNKFVKNAQTELSSIHIPND